MIKRLRDREIFKTKLFTIKDIDMQLEDGKEVTYQIMEKSDTALIVPINDKGNLILVKEYYYAINEYQYGLLKGRIEGGSDDFEKLIDEGKLTEARMIVALYLARRLMNNSYPIKK